MVWKYRHFGQDEVLLLREQVRDLADMNLLLRRELTARDRGRITASETVETISEIEEPLASKLIPFKFPVKVT